MSSKKRRIKKRLDEGSEETIRGSSGKTLVVHRGEPIFNSQAYVKITKRSEDSKGYGPDNVFIQFNSPIEQWQLKELIMRGGLGDIQSKSVREITGITRTRSGNRAAKNIAVSLYVRGIQPYSISHYRKDDLLSEINFDKYPQQLTREFIEQNKGMSDQWKTSLD